MPVINLLKAIQANYDPLSLFTYFFLFLVVFNDLFPIIIFILDAIVIDITIFTITFKFTIAF